MKKIVGVLILIMTLIAFSNFGFAVQSNFKYMESTQSDFEPFYVGKVILKHDEMTYSNSGYKNEFYFEHIRGTVKVISMSKTEVQTKKWTHYIKRNQYGKYMDVVVVTYDTLFRIR